MEIQILTEMLNDRGFDVSFDTQPYIAVSRESPLKRILIVLSEDESNTNISTVKTQLNLMKMYDVDHSILAYRGSLTPSAQKAITCLQDYRIELFTIQELQYNVTKHNLVPKHTLSTNTQIKKYRDSLPIILQSDPICRYYDFKRGNIIEVERRNGLIVYRIVR